MCVCLSDKEEDIPHDCGDTDERTDGPVGCALRSCVHEEVEPRSYRVSEMVDLRLLAMYEMEPTPNAATMPLSSA